MSNELELKLKEAQKMRDQHVADMGSDYSAQAMDRLAALQKMVAAAEEDLRRSTEVNTTTEAVGDMCVVTLVQGGKNDRCVEVPANGNTLADLINSIDMSVSGLTFKRRMGPGVTSEIANPEEFVLEAGTHEIFVTPKVVGG